MQQEDDLRGLAKVMDFMRVLSILSVVINNYDEQSNNNHPDEGVVTVPDNPNRIIMAVCEISELFGVFYQTAKRHIRTVEKSGVVEGDYKMTRIVDVHGVHPEYYGLEMIAALAFRFNSWPTTVFRRWIVEQVTRTMAATPHVLLWNVPHTAAMQN